MTTFTKEEILKDTIEFYGADPKGRRGYDEINKACMYKTPDGHNCALGRRMTPAALSTLEQNRQLSESISSIANNSHDLDMLLLEEYRGHPYRFWELLQEIHDYTPNWSITGLTERGLRDVQDMCMTLDMEVNEVLTPEQLELI